MLDIAEHQFYHLYNRTNNSEIAFKEQRNYILFLKKYRRLVAPFVETHAYCLMPTHFHFLIRIRGIEELQDGAHLKGGPHQKAAGEAKNTAHLQGGPRLDSALDDEKDGSHLEGGTHLDVLRQNIGIWQSSYTKAINKAYKRHGSLFQQHAKAMLVDEESYLISLINYIHQNPVRGHLVKKLEQWRYSSYLDLAGRRNGTLVLRDIIDEYFKSAEEFISFSEEMMTEVKKKYWVNC